MQKNQKKKIPLNRTKDGKHVGVFLIFSAIVIVLILSVGSLILPDVKMSENENRYLTQAPDLNLDDVLEGEYESKLEEYLSDQIIGREKWIKIMSRVSKDLGATDVNGVYILKDGRLIERKTESEFLIDRYKNNLDAVSEFEKEVSEGGTEVKVLLVPSAAYSYREEFNSSTNFDEKGSSWRTRWTGRPRARTSPAS